MVTEIKLCCQKLSEIEGEYYIENYYYKGNKLLNDCFNCVQKLENVFYTKLSFRIRIVLYLSYTNTYWKFVNIMKRFWNY